MLSSVVLASLCALGPPEREQPVISPTQPQPGEPAIAPARIDSERAGPEPEAMPADPVDPDPSAQPEPVEPEPADPDPSAQPESEPALPSWESAPPEPGPEQGIDHQPIYDPYGQPVEPVEKPPVGGGPMFGVAAGLVGITITRQWITAVVCLDVYCGNRGLGDDALMVGTMALAGYGGWRAGARKAWIESRDGAPPSRPTGRRAAGWTLFALGFGGFLADTVLYNICYSDALGPYTKIDGFSYTCSPEISAAVTDLTGLTSAVGLGLGLSAEAQIRTRSKWDAELSVLPYGGRGHLGLSLSGRF